MRLAVVFAFAFAMLGAMNSNATHLPRITTQEPHRFLTLAAAVGDHAQSDVPEEFKGLAKSIGRIRPFTCTAFCVAPQIIATSAHCLGPTYRNRSRSIAELRFELDGKQTPINGNSNSEKMLNTFAGTTRATIGNDYHITDQGDFDWAVVRLQRPACRGRELMLSDKTFDDITSLTGKTFSIFFNKGKLKFSKCDVRKTIGKASWKFATRLSPFPEELLIHNCDTNPGASGGPLFYMSNKGPEVIGIQQGVYHIDPSKKLDAMTAVHINAIKPHLRILENLAGYPSAESIKRSQFLLTRTGDYKSVVDGAYGIGTRQAILDYTLRNSLPVAIDRPTETLNSIIERERTVIPFPEMLNGVEAYLYHPERGLTFKAFGYHAASKTWSANSGAYSNEAALAALKNSCRGGKKRDKLCDMYAINDTILVRSDGNGRYVSVKYTNSALDNITDYHRKKFRSYIQFREVRFKAMSLNESDGRVEACYNQISADSAIECARSKCSDAGDKCSLLALGNKIVFGSNEKEITEYKNYYEEVLGGKF